MAQKEARRDTAAGAPKAGSPDRAGGPEQQPEILILAEALEHQEAGDLDAAEQVCRRYLEATPDDPEALHILGTVQIQQGNSAAAVASIEQALAIAPHNDQYLANLGAALQSLGRTDEAIARYEEALKLNPSNAAVHANLGVLRREQGETEAARESLEEARRLNPDARNVLVELGNLYLGHEQFEEAADCYRRYLDITPGDASVTNNLGFALARLGRSDEATSVLLKAFEDGLRSADICNNLANLFREQGDLEEADVFAVKALEMDPERTEYRLNHASILIAMDRLVEASKIYTDLSSEFADDPVVVTHLATLLLIEGRIRDALDMILPLLDQHPDNVHVWTVCGDIYNEFGEFTQSEAAYRRALEIDPNNFQAKLNLTVQLRNGQKFDEAASIAREVIAHDDYEPKFYGRPYYAFRAVCDFEALESFGDTLALIKSTPPRTSAAAFLGVLNEVETPEQIARMVDLHRAWGRSFDADIEANPLPPLEPRSAGGPIRVGFLSSDLRTHAVTKHVMSLFRNFDRDRFEIYCYCPHDLEQDQVQTEIKEQVNAFRIVENMSYREIAEKIRNDGIDILMELNGHTQGNRLPVLAYRPARVQISWLGYPFSSGLSAVDYFVVDEKTRPARDEYLLEKPLVLPESWVTFDEYPPEPITETLPFERNGHITFGSLNNPYKFTPMMIDAWARIMRAVPDSHFLFVQRQADSLVFRSNMIREFGKQGIDPERLLFYHNESRNIPHLACYNEIDISLDTFPVTGGTTTCDALWMGVPVITLVGEGPHQRLSHSLLSTVDLEDLCAYDIESYIEKAIALANDHEPLAFLRQHLRPAIENSILCDGERFSKNFFDALLGVAKAHDLA